MAISKVSDLNSLYNDIYADALVVLRENNLMMAGGLVTMYNGSGFATRKVPTYSAATVNIKPEGVDYANPTTYSKTEAASFTPQTRFAQFLLTDEMIATEDSSNIVAAARAELGLALAEQADEDMLAEFTNFTASKGTANSALSVAIVGTAIAKLNAGKVMGQRVGVLHPLNDSGIAA